MELPITKQTMKGKDKIQFEFNLIKEFTDSKDDTKHDLLTRVGGVPAKAGAAGYQFAGYTRLERFYRGDQWETNPAPGASQRTDNYCAAVVDNISSLIFDDEPEINCPTNDPSDELLEIKAEIKEKLIQKVWEDNGYMVEFDETSKVGSVYGDSFIKGPWVEKEEGKYVFKFSHVENPGSIRLIWADTGFKKLHGFIDTTRVSHKTAQRLWGKQAEAKGIKIEPTKTGTALGARADSATELPMVDIDEYWTEKIMAIFINDKLVDYWMHNWGFVALEHIKNIYSPNRPYGKSDIEDILDPQLMYNQTNNDLANLLKWLSTVNLWGKNIEGMEALVSGLSKIYSVPEDGELHTFEKPGDAYITNTFAQQRRSAIVELSGVSEQMLSSGQLSNSSGRALAMAFQGTIRKITPRIKRYSQALQKMNEKILKLYQIYYPQTQEIINNDFRNKVFLPTTILRNIVDTINKLQSGIISLDTAQREAGVNQPKMEQKVMRKNLGDPLIGPQIARQPALLPRLGEGENQGEESPIPVPGNQPGASQGGAVAANNQQSGGASATPV